MVIWSTVLVFGLLQVGLAKTLSRRWDDVAEKHSWTEVPNGWVHEGNAPSDYRMNMRIGLRHGNRDKLIASLYEVSDPSHPRYGQHLSAEDVNALIAPHPDSLDILDDWLIHHDIDPTTAHRSGGNDWITINLSVSEAERMLDTTYNVYRHSASDDTIVRTMAYKLPKALHGHVDVISPTTYFDTTRSLTAASIPTREIKRDIVLTERDSSNCSVIVTPSCLRTLYTTGNYTPTATDKNTLGVVGYTQEYANYDDLQTFFKLFRSDAVGGNFTVKEVNGGLNDQSSPGIEANLDLQTAAGIVFPTPIIYYSVNGTPPYVPDSITGSGDNDPYLDWLNYILNQTDIPQVFTTSYSNDEQSVPPDYAQKVCDGFAQLGARGASVLFSSGDFGVGGGLCLTNDGKNDIKFQPKFPPSCPWVTAVGGTTEVSPEIGVFFSGGGFSNYFSAPDYQTQDVASFLGDLGSTYDGKYNKTGRGYPDVSAQGLLQPVVVDGITIPAGGTSASVPTFAAVVSLLNDYRLSNGKSSLGFLNPWLYANATAGLNDITSGTNPGCLTDGFTAQKGWDPVTGLGTPDFLKLQNLV